METEKRVAYVGFVLDRIVAEKVVQMWHWTDDWQMLKRIGAVPKLE